MPSLGAIVGITGLIVLLLLPWRSRPRCPECGGREIGVQKTATGMRTSDFYSSSEGGGYSEIQMQYTVNCRCNRYGAAWTKTETETR